jgi:hypothetical protein
VVSDLTHLTMSNETLVSQVQIEPPVIPKPPVPLDYADRSSSNPRPWQATNQLAKGIHKHDEVKTHRQQNRELESDEEECVSKYPDIDGFTRQMDNSITHRPKYATPYTNSRSKGVVPRTVTRESMAAPSMSWLTSASVANIRRGVQGYGTPTSPSLLYSNFHKANPSQSGRQAEPLGAPDERDDSYNHSFEDPILDESPLTRYKGPNSTHYAVGESGVQTINILSQNVKIRPVDNASFRLLMDLKDDVI